MGSHQSPIMGKDEWLTPPEIIKSLGPFDLDPCSPVDRPWPTANKHYTIEDNGLLMPWEGRVWCNPPYGKHTKDWLNKCALHGNAIAMIFARTETNMFFSYVWGVADAILFIRGRIKFYHVDGSISSESPGAPSVLIAYGENNTKALSNSGIKGHLVYMNQTKKQK